MTSPKNKKVVMAFGTFDFFHAGHEHYLRQAKKHGEYLIVVIAKDKTVRQIKGRQATHSEKKRKKSVEKADIADKVILGNEGDKYKVITKYRPAIIALGYDQFVFTQKLEKKLIDLKLNTTIVRLDAFFPQVFKSSLIRQQQTESSSLHDAKILSTASL